MKNKPKRHKESNTFKFKPFSERIASIDIDVFHRVGHKNETDEGSGTYFHKALAKWSDLNLTERFDACKKELPPTHTLPQLLQRKDEIVEVLIKYIRLRNKLCLQPVLELVVALAQDLRQEFYSYYTKFVEHLIDHLSSKDSEQLEWVFTCLAYIFKYLWRYIVKDVEVVFNGLIPLLDDSMPEYINNFAADSFAFVVRKLKDKRPFLLLVLKTLKSFPDCTPGCGRMLFAVMNGVSGQFHSCADNVLPFVIDMLGDETVPQKLLYEVLKYMVWDLLNTIHPKKSELFWSTIFKCIGLQLLTSRKNDYSSNEMPIDLMLKLVLQAVTYKNGTFVSDPMMVAQPVLELLKHHKLHEDSLLIVSEIGAGLLMLPAIRILNVYAVDIIQKVLAVTHKRVLLTFVERLLPYPAFETLVLPRLMLNDKIYSYNSEASDKVAGIGRDFLHFLTVLVLHKAPMCKSGMDLQNWSQFPVQLKTGPMEDEDLSYSIPLNFMDEVDVKSTDEILEKLEDFICIVICLPHIKVLCNHKTINILKNVLTLLCASLKGEVEIKSSLSERNDDIEDDDLRRVEENESENIVLPTGSGTEVEDHGSGEENNQPEEIELLRDSEVEDQGRSEENSQSQEIELLSDSETEVEDQGTNEKHNHPEKIKLPTDSDTKVEDHRKSEENNQSENIELLSDSDTIELVVEGQGGSEESNQSEIAELTNSDIKVEGQGGSAESNQSEIAELTNSDIKVEGQGGSAESNQSEIAELTNSDVKVEGQGGSAESNQSEIAELTNSDIKVEGQGGSEESIQSEKKELDANGDIEMDDHGKTEESNKSVCIELFPGGDTKTEVQGRTEETKHSESKESLASSDTKVEDKLEIEESNQSEKKEDVTDADIEVEDHGRNEESNQAENMELDIEVEVLGKSEESNQSETVELLAKSDVIVDSRINEKSNQSENMELEIEVVDLGKSEESNQLETVELLAKIDVVVEEEGRTKILLFVLKVVLETLIHLVDKGQLKSVCSLDMILKTVLPYASNPRYVNSLRILDLYLTAYNLDAEDNVLHPKLLRELHSKLLHNMSSPFHAVRFLTAHILSLFEFKESKQLPVTDFSIFRTCLAAELIPADLHGYRDKLKCLQKLEFTAIQSQLLKHPEFNKVPLHFLLGNLYINFEFVWEPTMKLINTLAHGLSLMEFWEVFREKLHVTTQQIKNSPENSSQPSELKCDFLKTLFSEQNNFDDKPDYVNYRLLLWKAMIGFLDISESRNRDISPLFLSFFEEEYFNSNEEMAFSYNIKSVLNVEEDGELMDVDEEPSNENREMEEIKNELSRPPKPSKRSNGKALLKTVLAHLNVFSKMRDPKSMYKEKELKKVYLNCLTHRNPEVQKGALDCLLAYKYKYLTPYQQHLYGLIDDRTFMTELTQFRVDKESDIIQKEHRTDLIPVVMRIAYSKMLMKTSSRSGHSKQVRRSLVLRFLAGCHESELIIFLEMAFKQYAEFVSDDPKTMVDSIINNLDLEHIIPPKRLLSSLHLLSIIMERFGRLMGEKLLSYVLRLLLCISSIVQGALAQRESLDVSHYFILHNLRNTSQEKVARFFEHMETYPWSEVELDAIFRILVWPCLEKLPIEGIHSPTTLLKLFLVWSRNPRYFVLLGRYAEGNEALTPLPYIMNLLNRTQTHPSVAGAIMELVERLLTFQDYDESGPDAAPKIPDTLTLPIDQGALTKLSGCRNLNYGSYLLIPHIPAILERLKRKLETQKNRSLNQRELMVLSRATELVWDVTTSDTLLSLILPILSKKAGGGEETVSHLITTLDNLFRNVEEPEKHLRHLAPLFGIVSAIGPRKLLIELLRTISKCCSEDQREKLQSSAELICKLNAFDAKWIEQPDFGQRLDAFGEIQEMLEEEQFNLELGAIILHNCFHFIRTGKDMSLKDSAGHCLRTLAPAICLQYINSQSNLQYILSYTVLNLIRAGIKDKNGAVQYESIKLLGVMARECGDIHPILQDLSKLANKADMEVDFFENIVHLQSHRKSRALLKFCSIAKELTKAPNPKTLTQFIFPLASMFLCSEKHGHKHTTVSAAIDAFGVICQLLPWHQYETILRFYLAKLQHDMEYQKQLVRIVVTILDAFHFDLSRAEISNECRNEDETPESQENNIQEIIETEPEKSIPVEKNKPNTKEEAMSEELLQNTLDVESEVVKQDEEEQDSEIVNSAVTTPVRAIEKQAVLTKSVAKYAIQTITSGLLPHIHKVMAQLTQSDVSHKLSKKQTAAEKEDESILRIPIALAAVKLLQRLPSYMLEQNLRGILIKLSTFLKSRLDSIRRVTRETLQKIMLTLGPKYLETLIDEMSVMLKRGYQVHVLIYTIHAVLVTLKDKFESGDIDSCLQKILELCKKDLFGAVAEEKEINQITGKLFEAKAMKSFDTFHILAQFITEKCFVDLLVPIKEVLADTHSFKVIHKCSECLRQVIIGLAENTFVPIESLLIFMYGVASESIPDLVTSVKKEEITPTEKELIARKRPDTFIIPAAPRNRFGSTVVAKVSSKTNAHILVEFGLQLFHTLLKRESVHKSDFRTYIDPMVSILCDCMKAQHVKLTTKSLKCLSWILKMDLPSLKTNINSISVTVFKLLHKYAAAGLSKGDNFDLVVAAFKVVAVIVRDVKYYTINEDQMKTLLLYAEQDMHDYNRQATAFILLKAVLSRKLIAREMHDVMSKVATLSVTSEYSHVRLQARQVFHQFLMEYPLGKKLEKHIGFYVSQMDYKLKTGRESALEMVQSMITSFPERLLAEQSGLLYITLGARLVNDDSPDCRKMAAHCIKTMLQRLIKQGQNQLFDITIEWLKDNKIEHRRLAVQLCGFFVTVEKSDFENRLPMVFPLMLKQFSAGPAEGLPGRFVRAPIAENNSTNVDRNEKVRDHLLFQVLQFYLKLCTSCPDVLNNEKWQENMEIVTENCQVLLAHPHEWVRLGSAQLLGQLFSSLDADTVAKAALSENHEFSRTECGYFYCDTKFKLKSLILDLCAQLQPCELSSDLIEQVLKNLVFLGRILKRISITGQDNEEDESVGESESNIKISLLWMIRKMRKIVNMEIIQLPKSTNMRTAVFKWIGTIVVDLGREGLPSVAYQLLSPLARELNSTNESDAGKQLCVLAKQVASLIKKKLGMETYTRHLARLQTNLDARRANRKKQRAMEVLTEPEKAAKRKINRNLKKKEFKKRKYQTVKDKKFKKKKRKSLEIEDM